MLLKAILGQRGSHWCLAIKKGSTPFILFQFDFFLFHWSRLLYLAQNELKVFLLLVVVVMVFLFCFVFSFFLLFFFFLRMFFTLKSISFKVLGEPFLGWCIPCHDVIEWAIFGKPSIVSLILKMIQIDNITMGFLLCLEIEISIKRNHLRAVIQHPASKSLPDFYDNETTFLYNLLTCEEIKHCYCGLIYEL